jgi:hypothetical protein
LPQLARLERYARRAFYVVSEPLAALLRSHATNPNVRPTRRRWN